MVFLQQPGNRDLIGIRAFNCVTKENSVLVPGNVQSDRGSAFFFMDGKLFFCDSAGRPCDIDLDRPGEVNVLG